ncbi:MAG: S41 family peptidase, partial [Proteobacteria bacterium]|nr:S41 family peptidase [Pseudomonadota bacterium]
MRNWNKILQYALWPVLSIALYFLLDLQRDALDRSDRKPFNLSSRRPLGDLPSNQTAKKTSPQELADRVEITDSLLLDSIMTIIQNYYVDESRVESRRLMESTLKAIYEQDIAQLQVNTANTWVLSKDNDSINLKFSSRYTYDELMRDAIRVSHFLQEHKGTAVPGHQKAQGASLFLSAMLASLDPHSSLLSPDEYRDLRQGTEGSFGGLGVVVGIQDDVLTVIKPLAKSPAARAGVSKFDRIMQIDDKSTFGTTLDDLVQYMRGDPGTKVNLLVLREGDFAPRKLSLTREIIQVDSVESKLINSDQGPIFYAFIDSFSSRTALELRDALLKAQQEAEPLAGIILDMRSNPGGLLDQAVKVADLFIDEGRIVSTQGRTREFEVAKRNIYNFDYPLVILSNGDMASASEIVAGALRDHGRALVIGEPSFGKGSVQTVFELPGEQALKLTIARYFTPKGISIQNMGIMPDIWLQPVHRGTSNVNILGEYRYKSERFLEHSLDQDKLRSAAVQAEEWKAFYLLPDNPVRSSTSTIAKDIPLEFAERFLIELGKKDGVPLPKERLRASYWKASTSQLLRDSLKRLNAVTRDWMQAKLNLDWSEDAANSLSVVEGQPAMIPWTIKNFGREPIYRLSVFVSTNHGSLGTNEILVGRIEPGQELHGVLNYELKLEAKESPVRLRVGLAKSGWPLPDFEHPLVINLTASETPKFEISMKLSREQGGQKPGILEPGEQAQLDFYIKNASKVGASQVDAKIVNLAGKQVVFDDRRTRLGSMAAGEIKIVRIPLKASFDLTSE